MVPTKPGAAAIMDGTRRPPPATSPKPPKMDGTRRPPPTPPRRVVGEIRAGSESESESESGSESESESELGSQRPLRPTIANNATFELVCKASLEIACDRCSMVTMCSDAAIKGVTAVLQKNLGLTGSAYVKIDGKDIHKQGSQYSCVDCERDDIDCDADAGEEKTALRRRRLLSAAAGTQEALLGEGQMSGVGEGGLVVGYAVRGLGSKQKRSDAVRVCVCRVGM